MVMLIPATFSRTRGEGDITAFRPDEVLDLSGLVEIELTGCPPEVSGITEVLMADQAREHLKVSDLPSPERRFFLGWAKGHACYTFLNQYIIEGEPYRVKATFVTFDSPAEVIN